MTDLDRIAHLLDTAARTAESVPQVSLETPFTLDEAYDIQHRVVQLRVDRQDVVTGVKLGFTNPAKAAQMGLSDVIVGQITSDMAVADGGILDRERFIHVRAEPELAFRLGVNVNPADPRSSVYDAVDAVAPAIEFIDSRYRNFKFTLEDVVADNTSASAYTVGQWVPFGPRAPHLDISNCGVTLELDGHVVESGSTAAILGNPLRALDATKRMAAAYGFALPAGTIILAGAATIATAVGEHTTVTARVSKLGTVSARFSGGE
ncbi:fumarylacetoacetate hydrolase family protein [Klugiella xanthotipulae]|uniref:2-oxo-3-hexenedioate decarboxylase n=1 Tax=Klugiella xanthotipulae TaxID=244735 RepID=A0A543HTB2_9MICO|nr:fumarylacetoacetate hydrolase family protein [Klugiella xanthotipulae]TQM61499.1 2-oxo-3-hexenedioate decarboxylase [Klugiella xanthotipulae]